MTVSIVTPWLDHPEHLGGYHGAVSGADEVIVVLNRGRREWFAGEGFMVLEPAEPLGFSASNNLGAARATGDIVVYMNNDVAGGPGLVDAIRADVADGGLYGPSIGYQRLAGVAVPYVEGWCAAATRVTWERIGPWDAEAFPRPYWEDVDISLRAIRAGVELRRTPWAIRHLGGTTTRSEPGAWDGFEHQRAVMEARVAEAVAA